MTGVIRIHLNPHFSWKKQEGKIKIEKQRLTHSGLEPVKWIAVAAMTVDHAGKIVFPEWYTMTNAIGRIAFPLFAWIIGKRLSLTPGLSGRYIKQLTAWMLISQPFFVYSGSSGLNIFFTLALGTVLFHGLNRIRQRQITSGLILICLSLLFSVKADYRLGIFIIPITAMMPDKFPLFGAVLTGGLAVLSNYSIGSPTLGPGAGFAFFAGAIVWFVHCRTILLPRLPGCLFYAYYPFHLILLRAIAQVFR